MDNALNFESQWKAVKVNHRLELDVPHLTSNLGRVAALIPTGVLDALIELGCVLRGVPIAVVKDSYAHSRRLGSDNTIGI